MGAEIHTFLSLLWKALNRLEVEYNLHIHTKTNPLSPTSAAVQKSGNKCFTHFEI